jgi:hypothetical protein
LRLLEAISPYLFGLDALDYLFGFGRVVPKVGLQGDAFFVGDMFFFGIVVKDSPVGRLCGF